MPRQSIGTLISMRSMTAPFLSSFTSLPLFPVQYPLLPPLCSIPHSITPSLLPPVCSIPHSLTPSLLAVYLTPSLSPPCPPSSPVQYTSLHHSLSPSSRVQYTSLPPSLPHALLPPLTPSPPSSPIYAVYMYLTPTLFLPLCSILTRLA